MNDELQQICAALTEVNKRLTALMSEACRLDVYLVEHYSSALALLELGEKQFKLLADTLAGRPADLGPLPTRLNVLAIRRRQMLIVSAFMEVLKREMAELTSQARPRND